MQPLQSDLVSTIQKRTANPAEGTEPIRLGLMSRVNQRYKNLPDKVTTQLAQRGYAKSGQLGSNLKGVELSRMSELGDIDTQIAQMILGREDTTMDLANRLLSAGRGVSSTGTQSGNMLGGGVNAGIETLTTMLLMDKLMKGAGGGAGADVNYGATGSW